MRRIPQLFLPASIAVVASCVAVQPPRLSISPPGSTAKWEYRQELLCHAPTASLSQMLSENTDLMNRLGKEQWELISILPSGTGTASAERQQCWVFVFKRRLSKDR